MRKVCGAEGPGSKDYKGVNGYSNSGPKGGANTTNGGRGSGAAEEADSRAGLAEAAIELLLELGEAAAHVIEVVGMRTRERVVEAVEFKEKVEGAIALGLGEEGRVGVGVRVRVKRKDVEEGTERGVEGTCTIDAMEEEKAEKGGFLAVFEIGFYKTGEGVVLGEAKGVFHAITVGVKHLCQ